MGDLSYEDAWREDSALKAWVKACARTCVAMEHLPGAGPVEGESARIVCDGCGEVLELGFDAVDAPGWQLGPPDYCPDCA